MRSFLGSPLVMEACTTSDPLYHTAYMGRRWIMSSSLYANGTNIGNSVVVRLPYTVSELTELNNHAENVTLSNPEDGGNSLPVTRSNMMLTKISGSSEDGVANQADCVGQIRGVTNGGSLVNVFTIPNTEAIDFSIAQFSEFFLHKNNGDSPLPVTLTKFSASCSDFISINWTTASEQNSDYFEVEKSRDGQNWTLVDEQNAAGNSSKNINYSLVDKNGWKGLTYYRLKQVDIDGKGEVFGPISASCDGNESSISVFPNPNKGSFTVEILSDEIYTGAQLYLTDMLGKVITIQDLDISIGKNQIFIDQTDLKIGVYLVSIKGGDIQLKPVKVMVN
jgi:hypothetical protein